MSPSVGACAKLPGRCPTPAGSSPAPSGSFTLVWVSSKSAGSQGERDVTQVSLVDNCPPRRGPLTALGIFVLELVAWVTAPLGCWPEASGPAAPGAEGEAEEL